jgi:hypothetical protein
MLSMVTEAWPSKPVGAKFSDEPLQECHIDPSLSQGQDSVAFELWRKWRVNLFDYHWDTLSNYQSAMRVRANDWAASRPSMSKTLCFRLFFLAFSDLPRNCIR